MTLRKVLFPLVLVLTFAYADEIDAEIIKSLDFYQNLDLLKNWDLAAFVSNSEKAGEARPATETSNAKPSQKRDKL